MTAPLASLLEALAGLAPQGGDEAVAVARALGYSLGTATPVSANRPAVQPKPLPPPRPNLPVTPEATDPVLPEIIPSEIQRLPGTHSQPPAWLAQAKPLPRDRGPRRQRPIVARRHLFTGPRSRALLTTLAALPAAIGDIDLKRVVQRIAAARLVTRVPRRALYRSSGRVLFLIDEGRGMEPFAFDQIAAVQTAQRVLGCDAVQTLFFRGVPEAGVRRDGAIDYEPFLPPRDAVLILLTDMGVNRLGGEDSAGTAEWAHAMAACRPARGIVALIPYPPERWPDVRHPGLARIYWYETMSLPALRRAIKPSRTRP